MAQEVSLSLRQLRLNLEKLKRVSAGITQIAQTSEAMAEAATQFRKQVMRKTKWRHFEQEVEFYRKQAIEYVEVELPKMNESHSKIKATRPQHYLRMISIPLQHAQDNISKWLLAVHEALVYQDKKMTDESRGEAAKQRQVNKNLIRKNYCTENLQTIEMIVRRLESLEKLVAAGKADEADALIRGPPPTAVVQLEEPKKEEKEQEDDNQGDTKREVNDEEGNHQQVELQENTTDLSKSSDSIGQTQDLVTHQNTKRRLPSETERRCCTII